MQKIVVMLALGLGLALPARADMPGAMAAYQRQDYASAQRQLLELARQGEPAAQLYLGRLYEEGRGVGQDYAEAARWTRMAAERGDGQAQFNLAVFYRDGQGVVQNYQEALYWYRRAADQGELGAIYNLGWMYAGGLGVRQDRVRAYALFSLAAARDAARQGARDALAPRLTAPELHSGEELAKRLSVQGALRQLLEQPAASMAGR